MDRFEAFRPPPHRNIIEKDEHLRSPANSTDRFNPPSVSDQKLGDLCRTHIQKNLGGAQKVETIRAYVIPLLRNERAAENENGKATMMLKARINGRDLEVFTNVDIVATDEEVKAGSMRKHEVHQLNDASQEQLFFGNMPLSVLESASNSLCNMLLEQLQRPPEEGVLMRILEEPSPTIPPPHSARMADVPFSPLRWNWFRRVAHRLFWFLQ